MFEVDEDADKDEVSKNIHPPASYSFWNGERKVKLFQPSFAFAHAAEDSGYAAGSRS